MPLSAPEVVFLGHGCPPPQPPAPPRFFGPSREPGLEDVLLVAFEARCEYSTWSGLGLVLPKGKLRN